MSKKFRGAHFTGMKRKLQCRDERGAGGLLPIVMVGMIVVAIAASIASATAFASNVSRQQVAQVTQNMETNSLSQSFLSNMQFGTTLLPAATIDGVGSYKVYTSSNEAKPSTVSDPGVVPLSSGAMPANTRWVLAEMTSADGQMKTDVYSYTAKNAAVFDHAIDWQGAVTVTNSKLESAPGVEGPTSILASSVTASADEKATFVGSNIRADIYAENVQAAATTTLSGGELSGTLSSRTKIQFSNSPRVLGDVYSSSGISGSAATPKVGLERSYDNGRPTVAKRTAHSLALPGQMLHLSAGNCDTPAKLKASLEAIDRTTTVRGFESCAPSSWNTEVKMKADVIVHSDGNLKVEGLKVVGSQGTLGFSTASLLELKDVKYSEGAKGQFIAGGAAVISNSELTGAVANRTSAAGNPLTMTDSTLLYSPVLAPLAGSCGTASCAMGSAIPHFVRVS